MKWLRVGSAALLVVAFSACESFDGLTDLDVTNQNAADRARVLTTFGDLENFIGGAFQRFWTGHNYGGYSSMGLGTTADEISISWGNYDGRALSSEPRTAFNNSPSYSFNDHAETPWYQSYESISNVYDGMRAIEEDAAVACAEINCDRIRAWAKFVQGVAHGWLALFFDSAFVLDESVDLFDATGAEIKQPFQPYTAVWAAARKYLDSAATLASGASWTLPQGWIGASGNQLTGTQLAQLSRAHIARWIPQVARTPAERATQDWAKVVTAVDNGITADFTVQADADLWYSDYLYFNNISTSTTWSRADYKTIGQYDVSGNYNTWLNTPTSNRNEFLMPNHPDRRILPAANDGRGAGTDFMFRGASRFPAARGTYHYSFYLLTRYNWYPATQTGPMPYLLTEELQLNKAEGLLRTGGVVTQAIVDIVNATRVTRGGMPALTVANTVAQVHDAIIYERRIETFGTCSGCAFFHRRSQGPLSPTAGAAGGGFNASNVAIQHHQGMVVGTPLHFAVPGKELEVLERKIYTYGGPGKELGPPASGTFNPDLAAKYTVKAFYIPMDESLKRQADERLALKSLVRYVQ